ncbi:MAG: lipoate--protein ligase family protein, partial [Candidatus Bathyarchaeota archaeon]|nr:lipoate--protein ligase family protein [Candidatus Bathyarchaeota archaeon]
IRAYQYLGVKNAWYKHIGDVRVGLENRKITGFGFTTVANFLAMNQTIGIGKPDLDYFIDVVRIPEEKIKDKPYKTIEEYLYAGMTSVEQETGRKPSNDEVKNALVKAYDEVLGVKLVEHEISVEDVNFWLDLYEKVEKEVGDKQLFMVSSSTRFSSIPEDCMLGFARHKARKLIVAHVLVDRDGIIKDVMLSGDFYCKPFDYAERIEKNLKGVSVNDKATMLKKVKEVCSLKEWEAPLVEAEDFVEAVFNAGVNAYKKLTGKQ